MNEVKEKKKIGLTTRIFIALIAGAIVGIALNMFAADVDFVQNVLVNGIFYVVGQGFIRLMQMLVVPLVFCSLICGATAIGDSKTLGKVGVKIIGFYIFTTMMAVAVALGIGLLIKPGMGLDMSQIQTAEVAASSDSVSFAETLLNIIPKNPIGALANGEMLQVIVFALIVGVILAKLQDKTQLVTNFFQQGNDIMMEMTMMVMGLAPIGVFCLISKTFAGLGFSAMVPMFKYMGAVLLALFIQCCGVYQILLALLTRLNPLRFLKKFAPVMGFAFSTATSNATIPMNIDTLEEKNRRQPPYFVLHHPARRDHQYGWYVHHAGCCRCIRCTGVRHPAEPCGLSDRYCNRNARLHRYRRRAVGWSGYTGNGIRFGRSAGCRHRPDHGYRPYPRYGAYCR